MSSGACCWNTVAASHGLRVCYGWCEGNAWSAPKMHGSRLSDAPAFTRFKSPHFAAGGQSDDRPCQGFLKQFSPRSYGSTW